MVLQPYIALNTRFSLHRIGRALGEAKACCVSWKNVQMTNVSATSHVTLKSHATVASAHFVSHINRISIKVNINDINSFFKATCIYLQPCYLSFHFKDVH